MHRFSFVAFAATLLVPAATSAHFPFLHWKTDGDRPAIHVYFAESAEPDDPALLDRLAGADLWRVRADGESEPLKVAKGTNSLTTTVADAGPAAFGFHKDYGILSRGDATFRLVYDAKTFTGRDAWTIRSGERSPLEIIPVQSKDGLALTVLWKGKPLANADVTVQGGADFEEGKTDADGRFACKTTSTELYSIRAKHVEETPGERDGKKYDAVRYYATLTLDLK